MESQPAKEAHITLGREVIVKFSQVVGEAGPCWREGKGGATEARRDLVLLLDEDGRAHRGD